jgi:hypothetical protein
MATMTTLYGYNSSCEGEGDEEDAVRLQQL